MEMRRFLSRLRIGVPMLSIIIHYGGAGAIVCVRGVPDLSGAFRHDGLATVHGPSWSSWNPGPRCTNRRSTQCVDGLRRHH